MTPRELNPLIKYRADMLERDQDLVKWHAWHVVSLDRTRKLPSLQSFMSKKRTLEKARKVEGEEAEQLRNDHEQLLQEMGLK